MDSVVIGIKICVWQACKQRLPLCVLQGVKENVWWTTCRICQWMTESGCSERCLSVWQRREDSGTWGHWSNYDCLDLYFVCISLIFPRSLCQQDVSIKQGETRTVRQWDPLLQPTQVLHHHCEWPALPVTTFYVLTVFIFSSLQDIKPPLPLTGYLDWTNWPFQWLLYDSNRQKVYKALLIYRVLLCTVHISRLKYHT